MASAARPGELLKPADIYGTDEAAFFRQRRVREIVVLEQSYYQSQASGKPRALLVQQLDRQGRIVKEWKHPNGARFTTLEESVYDATGHLTDFTTYNNDSPEADTSRLGTSWQPDTHVHHAARPGQPGYSEQWDWRGKAWVRTENLRRWSSHDTTYVQALRQPGGTCGNLVRTYPTAGGRTRTDYLLTGQCFPNSVALFQPQYLYERREGGRLLEMGMLYFDDALQEYLRQHPGVPVPAQGTPAYSALLDYVACHATGRSDATTTRTYDPQGRLLVEQAKFSRIAYERNARGQATATVFQSIPTPKTPPILLARSAFTYLPSGLISSEAETQGATGPTALRYYRYRYY